ncbi:hypothetical protein ABH966_000138 [Lysinibacillus sp. RC46]|uniref:hypothetical protein n=1 Tax=Lysinibacillus sp. RC46 TaxID=3156295 RepID=UPI0035114AE7
MTVLSTILTFLSTALPFLSVTLPVLSVALISIHHFVSSFCRSAFSFRRSDQSIHHFAGSILHFNDYTRRFAQPIHHLTEAHPPPFLKTKNHRRYSSTATFIIVLYIVFRVDQIQQSIERRSS